MEHLLKVEKQRGKGCSVVVLGLLKIHVSLLCPVLFQRHQAHLPNEIKIGIYVNFTERLFFSHYGDVLSRCMYFTIDEYWFTGNTLVLSIFIISLETSSMEKFIYSFWSSWLSFTAQKMKFSIKDFFSKCDQIRSFVYIYWRNNGKLHFCAVIPLCLSSTPICTKEQGKKY